MTQKKAISLLLGDGNIFLTGPPGAGKTYVLNKYIKKASRKGYRVAVTATTGIAATHLKGITIHSWSGIGIKDNLSSDDKQKILSSEKYRKRYRYTDVLIIDEISMFQSGRLEMINDLAKKFRKNDKPFGGMKVVLVGDFFQLPPVNRTGQLKDFVFYSEAWNELNLQVCYLSEQYRQKEDDELLIFLNALRNDTLEENHFNIIDSRVNLNIEDKQITKLYSHNIDVDKINRKYLDEIKKSEHIYEAELKGSPYLVEQLSKNILAPVELRLKIGAEVMFVVNSVSEGYSNGSRGEVVKFDDNLPIVRLKNGHKIKVSKYSWTYKEDEVTLAEVKQIPLRLAWAITIHKSQGMSLDEAEIDLRGAFTPGMGYVAISRVRSLAGLFLKGYNSSAFDLFEEVRGFDFSLRFFSEALIDNLKANTDLIQLISTKSKFIDKRILDKLISLREEIGEADESIFILLPDTTLSIIASLKPTSIYYLKLIDSVQRKTIKRYGDQITNLVWNEFRKNNLFFD